MEFQKAFDEFLLYIEVEKNYSVHTVKSYALDLQMFENFLISNKRSLEMNDITRAIVRRFVQQKLIHDKVKPSTIQRKISSLKSFTRYCLQENILQQDFMAGIERPKIDEKLPIYMSLSELKKLFKYLDTNNGRFGLRNNLIFKLIATTGMRRSELVALCWQDANFDNQTLIINGKGKKQRLLPLHPLVLPLFEIYREELSEHQLHPSEPIFLNRLGTAIDPRGLHKVFKEILEKAGLPPQRFSLHHLRHTFATLLLQENKENVDLRIVQELLGHESLATTQVYTHVDFASKKKAIDSFNI